MNTNVRNNSAPINSNFEEWCKNADYIRLDDHIMRALQNREIYHSLNHLFETPLHYYECLHFAFELLPFDEMCGAQDTPLVDVIRAFNEIKDSLLITHLNAVKSNS